MVYWKVPFNIPKDNQIYNFNPKINYPSVSIGDSEIRKIITLCLSIDPKKRPSAKELLDMPIFNSFKKVK